jgi:DNA-directed RNA polymerase specialized sigma54-like protein
MAALTEKEVGEMLASAMAKAFEPEAKKPEANDATAAISRIEKSVQTLTEFVAKNVKVEKPASMEEMIASAVQKSLKDAGVVKEKTEEKADENKPVTAKELEAAIAKAVAEAIKEKPKAKGAKSEDAIDMLVKAAAEKAGLTDADMADEEVDEETPVAKELELTCETQDANGNELTKEQRVKRQHLDDFFGGVTQVIKEKLDDK